MIAAFLEKVGVTPATLAAANKAAFRTGADALASSALLGGGVTLAFTGDAGKALLIAVASTIAGAVVTAGQTWLRWIAGNVPTEYLEVGESEDLAEL